MSLPSTDTLQHDAADWFARLRGDADAETRAAFACWRDADPAHAAAYAQIEALWRDPDLAAALFAGPAESAAPRAAWPRRAAAAAVLVAILLTGLHLSGTDDTLLADHVAGSGLPQRVVLGDGSQLLLDAGAAVDVAYSGGARRVILRRGRVLADVQPDTARPFTVAAGDTTAQALGTVYAVTRRDSGAAVSVRAGEVLVTAPGQAGQVLQAGQGMTAGSAQPQPVAAAEFAWAENRLVFADQPLGAVLADLDRYWPGLIWVRDDKLAALPVSGSYRLDDPPAVVAALAVATGAQVSAYGGRLLILAR
jgi:transmembrane sensor